MYECNSLNTLNTIFYALILIGALNWGLVGAFDFNLVSYFLGDGTLMTRIIYLLVGVSAIGSLTLNIICSIRRSGV